MMQSKIKAWLRAWLPYVAVMVLLFWGVNAWRARCPVRTVSTPFSVSNSLKI